jgi:AhpD family alkylhydroperoxidase
MAGDVKSFYEDHDKYMNKMKKELPDLGAGFAGMYVKVMKKEGKLTLREKELIALGISVAVSCEPCINLHTKSLVNMGVSREEILEAASVAVVMGGGPAYVYMPQVLRAIEACEK